MIFNMLAVRPAPCRYDRGDKAALTQLWREAQLADLGAGE